MPKILALALHPSFDQELTVAKFERNQEMRVVKSQVHAGGKAVNLARALKSLKVPAEILGVWGQADADRVVAELSDEGLVVRPFVVPGETRRNITVRDLERNESFRILAAGPVVGSALERRIISVLAQKLKRINVLVLSGSLPPGLPSGFYSGLVRKAKRANVLSVLDSSGEPFLKGIQAAPFLVKPNREEAEALLGHRLSSTSGIIKALKEISAFGVNIGLISLGADGLAGTDGVRRFLASGPRSDGLRTIGCGDAALAGFLSGFLDGESFSDCLKFACACGSANTRVQVAGAINLTAVSKVFAAVKVKRL